MELKQIKAFIDAMASSDLSELEASKDGWTLKLVRRAGSTPTPRSSAEGSPSSELRETEESAAASSGESGTEVRAPLYGLVYLGPSPEAPPFVVAGQAVKAGDILCIIEAMKVFNNVCAARDGIVERILVESGIEVEAGQLLMRIA
ncbi:acetyl-CoA carboxylase biotin carboxyl carrier protein subunit [Bradyrhizobium sp. SSBR45G]|uniref:acetyl-CoA carboxylase biotin carboxyl carrier protein n=1 Tax=unclassified Bradyrhizobium TaxID=2631580 RepID=UPI002342B8C4|nr:MULTISPECIES: acetyl-CoA carboxylase biotin carboxyl carrier protein subunit [unclassified Bradyrhizobium]GLH76092.1 acetyl-CoA carboxylase biotin carboxyl carrier protein subunit [Bradyrhizobium sp. SSBR45G]GLH83424.1 acetyl-CoA carboxylase biotin carboxyl carrier protein subunit [Bradyrhizobium sp. SSBR45R]